MVTDKLDLLKRVIVDERRGSPLHIQLRKTLKSIIDEHFADGDLFWPEVTIAESLSLSRGTVRQALGDLAREGLLRRHHARGTFVTKEAKSQSEIRTIGLFVSDYEFDIAAQMIQRISETCRDQNLRVQIYHTHDGEQTASAYRQVERGPDSEGIVMLVDAPSADELYFAFTDRGYRTVCIHRTSSSYLGPSVETDAAEAVQIGVNYLTGLGHKKIALLVNEPMAATSVAEKVDTFRDFMGTVEDGQGSVVMCGTKFGESSYNAAYSAMPGLWEERPTAIFTVSDPGAWAVLNWLAEQKIDVPGEVSVLGFEDAIHSKYTFPALSTIAHPVRALATEAIKLIVEGRQEQVRFSPTLVVRKSTGTPGG